MAFEIIKQIETITNGQLLNADAGEHWTRGRLFAKDSLVSHGGSGEGDHQPGVANDVVDEPGHLERGSDGPDLLCLVPGLKDCDKPRSLLVEVLPDRCPDLRLEGRKKDKSSG